MVSQVRLQTTAILVVQKSRQGQWPCERLAPGGGQPWKICCWSSSSSSFTSLTSCGDKH